MPLSNNRDLFSLHFLENSTLATSCQECHSDNAHAIRNLEVPGTQCYAKEGHARYIIIIVWGQDTPQKVKSFFRVLNDGVLLQSLRKNKAIVSEILIS